MTRRQLIRNLDAALIEKAIGEAERLTSGEIRVSVAPLFWGSVDKAAKIAFGKLGMANTAQRNGVLIFVVPSRRKFVVLGDQGIHEKVGDDFWKNVVAGMGELFHAGHFTAGLIKGIGQIGEQLATHFPYDAKTDRDELSNEVNFA